MKIQISPLDKLVSEYVRKASRGFCARCGANKGWRRLQCCHFHGRAKKSVRWDTDNLLACCFGCHQYLDSHPLEKVEFWKAKLGETAFDLLNARARQMGKPDKALLTVYFTEKLKEMGEM